MSTRQQIFVNALRQRYDEVRKTASQLLPGTPSETTALASHLRNELLTPLDGLQFKPWTAPKVWFEPVSDSLATIRALAAAEHVQCVETARPEEPRFFEDLRASIKDPERRFELLTTRYLHPLNVAAPSEQRVREHLLERLMVADRSRIEQHSLPLMNAGDVLLKLNLIGIYASFTTDLRYLDALNYYYELLPSPWHPPSAQNWLQLSFLTFYVRALVAHLSHIN